MAITGGGAAIFPTIMTSKCIYTDNQDVIAATITATYTGDIAWYLSADNGGHWEAATPGVRLVFVNQGSYLRWRVVMNSGSEISYMEV